MEKNHTTLGYFFAFTTIVIWSGWMIISRLGMIQALTPFDVTFMRYTFAGIIMLPIAIKNKHLITRENYKNIFLMVMGAGAPYLLIVCYGLKTAPAAHGLLTPCSMPVIVAMLSFVMLKERITAIRLTGYFLIICGIIHKFVSIGVELSDIYFLSAAFLWATYTVNSKKMRHLSAIVATSFVTVGTMILILIPYIIYQIIYPHYLPISSSIQQILYQGILTSIISLITYNRALQIIGAPATSSFAALVPVMVIVLAIPFLDEIPTRDDIVFALFMSGGVFLASGIVKIPKKNQ